MHGTNGNLVITVTHATLLFSVAIVLSGDCFSDVKYAKKVTVNS